MRAPTKGASRPTNELSWKTPHVSSRFLAKNSVLLMAAEPKVFLSFSSEDREVARSLYGDLSRAGAAVFEFEQSATPGTAAWDEVLANIEASDIFILLASKSALKSRPVQEEVKFAFYQYVNFSRPVTLLPLVLEQGLTLPRELRALNQLSLDPYHASLPRLIALLNLQHATELEPKIRDQPIGPFPKPKGPARFDSGLEDLLAHRRRPGSLNRSIRIGRPTSDWQAQVKPGAAADPRLDLPSYRGSISTVATILKYAAVIFIIALLGEIIAWFAGPRLVSLPVEAITGTVRRWSDQVQWLSWSSRTISLMLVAGVSFYITDDEYPVDSADYVLVSAKSVGFGLLIGLIWSFLFSQVTGGSVIFTLISVGAAAVSVLLYAIKNEL
jgi:hypothetical protein